MNATVTLFADAGPPAAALAGVALATVAAVPAFLPLAGVAARLRDWRRELAGPAGGPIQAGHERDRRAAAADGREPALRRQFHPRWNAALGLAAVPFLVGLGTTLYARADRTGPTDLWSVLPVLAGLALSAAVGFAVWRQYAAANDVTDAALAKLDAGAAAEDDGRKLIERLSAEVKAKDATIAQLQQDNANMRKIVDDQFRTNNSPHDPGATAFDPPPVAHGGYIDEP